MKWLETLGRSYLSHTSTLGVAVWLGLPGAVLAQACCSGIIINRVPTNSPRCWCVDDKLCGTLHWSPTVTLTVCSAIERGVFPGSPGRKTRALTSGYTAKGALCGKGRRPGHARWSLQFYAASQIPWSCPLLPRRLQQHQTWSLWFDKWWWIQGVCDNVFMQQLIWELIA